MISERFYFLYWNSKRLRILKLAKWLRPCSSCTKGLNRLLVGQAAVGWTATYSSSTPAHLFTQVCNLPSRFFSLFSSFFLSFFLTMLVPSPLFFYLFLAPHHDNRPTVVYRCLVDPESTESRSIRDV